MSTNILDLLDSLPHPRLENEEVNCAEKRVKGKGEILTLAEYLERIMRAEKLSAEKIEEKSGRSISKQYVGFLASGRVNNPSVSKLKALAVGLGRSEEEVFRVARGLAVRNVPKPESVD